MEENSWVRVKRGTYTNDAGKVVSVDVNRQLVTVKLVPRIATGDGGTVGGRRKAPPARLFNPDEVDGADSKRDASGAQYYVYKGNKYKDGYLEKIFPMRGLVNLCGRQPNVLRPKNV